MGKSELIVALSEKAEITPNEAGKVLKAFIDIVTEELKKGEKVQLTGFGTFERKTRAARDGRNPQTGESIKIPESLYPSFKAGAQLKEAVKS